MKNFLMATLLAVGSAVSLNAMADVITYYGAGAAGDVPVTASAKFAISGDQLTITLTNTSPSHNGKDVDGSTLTGLFWDFSGNPSLIPVSATVAAGSILGTCSLVNDCATRTNVAGEFGYQAAQAGLPKNADRGIASSGYLDTGLNGNIGNFNNGAAGTDLDDPISLNGINFGIVSGAPGYNPNNGLAGEPVVVGSVTFVLTGVTGLSARDISHVSFQYGTQYSGNLNVTGTPEDGFNPNEVPEPGMVALFGLGLLGFAAARRKAVRK